MRKDGYTVVGPICKPNEALISLDDAQDLRMTLEKDFFGTVPTTVPEETERGFVVKAMHGAYGLQAPEGIPTMLTGASLHTIAPDTWRMIISQTKLRRTEPHQAQQRVATYLQIGVEHNEITQAVRHVKIMRDIGQVATASDMSTYDRLMYHRPMQRRIFERYLTTMDCHKAAYLLRRPLHL